MSKTYEDQINPLFEPWGNLIDSTLRRIGSEANYLSGGVLINVTGDEQWFEDAIIDLITKAWRSKEERWPIQNTLAVMVATFAMQCHRHLHPLAPSSVPTRVVCRAETHLAARLARDLALNIEESGYLHLLPGGFQEDGPWHATLQPLFEEPRTEEHFVGDLGRLLAASLSTLTDGALIRRRPLPLIPGCPILEVNNSRSDETMGRDKFLLNRMLAEGIVSKLEALEARYCCDATGRYAPFPPDQLPKDEEATLAGLLRSSGVITLASNPRAGTGMAVGLLASVGCPQLLVWPADADPACRYGGETYGYSSYAYGSNVSPEEISASCIEWVDHIASWIQKRHEKLMQFEKLPIDDIAFAVLATHEALFDSPIMSKRRALFWTSNPVYWHQCPQLVVQSILDVVGIETKDDLPGNTDFRSATSLLTYGRTADLQAGELLILWNEWHRRRTTRFVGSHKDYPMSVPQWAELDRSLHGGNYYAR